MSDKEPPKMKAADEGPDPPIHRDLSGLEGGTDGGVPSGYADGGFSGTTVVFETSSGGSVDSGGSMGGEVSTGEVTKPPPPETTPFEPDDGMTYVTLDAPPDLSGEQPEALKTGQADGGTMRDACLAAKQDCKTSSGCPAEVVSDKTCTCWAGGSLGYTCQNSCNCPPGGVA